MKNQQDSHSSEEQETVEKLKQAYIEDEGLSEDLAGARALAEVNRLAGRTDGSFDARSRTPNKRGGFQTDENEPDAS